MGSSSTKGRLLHELEIYDKSTNNSSFEVQTLRLSQASTHLLRTQFYVGGGQASVWLAHSGIVFGVKGVELA